MENEGEERQREGERKLSEKKSVGNKQKVHNFLTRERNALGGRPPSLLNFLVVFPIKILKQPWLLVN